ncbi:hypothetical protein ETH_00025645 [Eimeria tenella]|uniref:Thrombospondin type 1 domain-containing protein n=1 Tax=Eimeria tenella TaxID=5802 RepID=U6L6Q6_EIMTE|nr:hypothetical protein ETH_00025645 [Eimeria tenella]CDJ43445.1 hypothetical protein ETH_00025645 [Eimeria tenella]|eukprot:XP_013234195.1 hypothetical protein ETH_00025645 [Eimeria tenella]
MDSAAFSETALPKCFPSLTRMNDEESSQFRFLDPSSSSPQCLCLAPNSVPCTAAEVYEMRESVFSSIPANICPSQDSAGAIFGKGMAGTADSKLYFAAANAGKIFCPLSNSKSITQPTDAATYTTFASSAELNEYCANGLHAQQELAAITPYNVDINCENVTSKSDTLTPEECKAKCVDIRQSCEENMVDFLSCFSTERQTTGFDNECATNHTSVPGRGIIFCKLIPRDCKYSEWGEWSACSATCRSSIGGLEGSVRIRTRRIVEPSTTGGQQCRLGSISKEFDDSVTLSLTPKPEPSIEEWRADRLNSTTTSTQGPAVRDDITCDIVDMSTFSLDTRFDTQVSNVCRCSFWCLARAKSSIAENSAQRFQGTLRGHQA